MSDKAEAALEERYKSDPKHTPSHHYYRRGFLDGYDAAAYADCEAMVREAVTATIEEAAHSIRNSTRTDDWFTDTIRALDPEPIVRRVMKETENVTEQ